MKKIVINGFGRIGRLAFRELIGSKEYKVVGINGRGTSEEMAYLLNMIQPKEDSKNHQFHSLKKASFLKMN